MLYCISSRLWQSRYKSYTGGSMDFYISLFVLYLMVSYTIQNWNSEYAYHRNAFPWPKVFLSNDGCCTRKHEMIIRANALQAIVYEVILVVAGFVFFWQVGVIVLATYCVCLWRSRRRLFADGRIVPC